MQSNYSTRGWAVCVTTAEMSDQQRAAGREDVALHACHCKNSTDSHCLPPPQTLISKWLKTSCKIECATLTLQRYWPQNAIIFWATVWETASWWGEGLLQGYCTDLPSSKSRAIKHHAGDYHAIYRKTLFIQIQNCFPAQTNHLYCNRCLLVGHSRSTENQKQFW